MPLNRTYQLASPDFQDIFVDSNNTQLMVSMVENLPSANIEAATRAYCLINPYLKSFFRGEINYYRRSDYGQRTLPALNIYTQDERQDGSFGYLDGKLVLEVIMATENNRELITDNTKSICNYILLILNGLDYYNFVNAYCNGVLTIGFNQDWSYDKSIAAADKKSQDCYIAKAESEYKISLLEYYMSLWGGETYEGAHIRVKPT